MNLLLVEKNSAYKKFHNDVLCERVNHAYLVISEDEELRKAFFTKACIDLLCPLADEESAEYNAVLTGNYVEIISVDAKDGLKASNVEGLIERIGIKPVVGKYKVVIIDNADKLHHVVQNKLLKTYEEPPAYVVFFMGTGREKNLLATIRSRGKKLYLEDLSPEEITKELITEGFDEESASVASAISMGNYGKALKFCMDEKYRNAFNDTMDVFINMKKSAQVPVFAYKNIFNKENLLQTLDFMEIILSDVLKETVSSTAPRFTVGREYDLKEISKGFTCDSAQVSINLVNEARKKLNANINHTVVTTQLLMGILEAKYKWQRR